MRTSPRSSTIKDATEWSNAGNRTTAIAAAYFAVNSWYMNKYDSEEEACERHARLLLSVALCRESMY